jgi:hypothetical protein
MLRKNSLQRSFCLINIPRQRDVSGPQTKLYCFFIRLQGFKNYVIAFNLQFVKNSPASVPFADAGNIHLKAL